MRSRYPSCIHRHHQSLHLHPLFSRLEAVPEWPREKRAFGSNERLFSEQGVGFWKKSWLAGAREFIFLRLALDWHCLFLRIPNVSACLSFSLIVHIFTHTTFPHKDRVWKIKDVRIWLEYEQVQSIAPLFHFSLSSSFPFAPFEASISFDFLWAPSSPFLQLRRKDEKQK